MPDLNRLSREASRSRTIKTMAGALRCAGFEGKYLSYSDVAMYDLTVVDDRQFWSGNPFKHIWLLKGGLMLAVIVKSVASLISASGTSRSVRTLLNFCTGSTLLNGISDESKRRPEAMSQPVPRLTLTFLNNYIQLA